MGRRLATLLTRGGGVVVLAVGGFWLAVGSASASGFGPPSGSVLGVRFGGGAEETRIVIDLDGPTTARPVEVDAPNQVLLSMANLKPGSAGMRGEGRGLVTAWALEPLGRDAQLSLTLADGTAVARRFLLPPGDGIATYRYVIDLRGKSGAARPGSGPAAKTLAPIRRAALPIKKVIVIDAGHGGKDPGAAGSVGQEKDVTLAAALALKTRLQATGRYTVVLTRDADAFVPLEARVQVARRVEADLFISLHADSGPDASTRGASVYTLSEAGTTRVAKVLDRNEWFMTANTTSRDRAVGQILLDLSQRATKNRSAGFAELLLDHLGDETPLLQRGHRDAGYVVLLAPDVPAVLVEMGFMTNADDEASLTSPVQRRRLIGAMGDAIDAWFAQETRLASR